MIDWLTLRHPLTEDLGPVIHARILDALGKIVCISPTGEKQWEKASPDWEAIRSDTPGLMWSVTGNADGQMMLTIGASPAALEHGLNVFGSSDIRYGALVLLRYASKCLGAVLPPVERWECRRCDVTHNYDLGSYEAVKQALRILMGTDSARRRATTKQNGGDSIYWSPSSDLQSGKAYHKGPHLRFIDRKRKLEIPHSLIELADRLLRFELKLGSRWFRRLEEGKHDLPRNWLELSESALNQIHFDFFAHFIGNCEVTDMGTLLQKLFLVAPTAARAEAAYSTYQKIRDFGYENMKACYAYRSQSTWYDHIRLLKAAGLSDADICASNILPFRSRQIVLERPVSSWDDLRRAA